ncbi:MAG: hypothetical protein P4L53_24480 [Candidatus Obscuribacterales bacterium]|nr:hypothetical protein [Candidatus Obscuribacterales bacterium]
MNSYTPGFFEAGKSSGGIRPLSFQHSWLDNEPLFDRTTETYTAEPSLMSRYGAQSFNFDF